MKLSPSSGAALASSSEVVILVFFLVGRGSWLEGGEERQLREREVEWVALFEAGGERRLTLRVVAELGEDAVLGGDGQVGHDTTSGGGGGRGPGSAGIISITWGTSFGSESDLESEEFVLAEASNPE